MSTFIIAEAGVNHGGDLETAKRMVDAAVRAGADAVKFQTFSAEKIVTRAAPKAGYQAERTGGGEGQLEMLRRLELSGEAHRELFSRCKEEGIVFMSTPFDPESADMLEALGIDIFKIPSGEITNKPLVRHIASKERPVILSTGMSSLDEVEKAVGWITEVWKPLKTKPLLTLMHCVSNYPASPADANLACIKTMKEAFKLPVGFSDHTMGIEVSVAAVALGASVIEKHFTLDRSMEGPDHKASLEPGELEEFVAAIRNVEKAIGDGVKQPTKSEEGIRLVARRSLVAARDIRAGAKISMDDIAVKRPGTGIAPEFLEEIVGMTAVRDISEDTIIRREDLKGA